jgi:hypothetical protein
VIRWKMVDINIEGRKEDVLVVEYTDGPFVCYWVKLGGLIDATVREHYGPYIVGIGAKKYAAEIKKAIWDFQYGFKYGNLEVIKGGRIHDKNANH